AMSMLKWIAIAAGLLLSSSGSALAQTNACTAVTGPLYQGTCPSSDATDCPAIPPPAYQGSCITTPPPPSPRGTLLASANCNLVTAAFCDTFEEGASTAGGRGGDLDPTKWSSSRLSGRILLS